MFGRKPLEGFDIGALIISMHFYQSDGGYGGMQKMTDIAKIRIMQNLHFYDQGKTMGSM